MLLVSIMAVRAQADLVPNGSFENYSICPIGFSCIDTDDDTYVDNWVRASAATSDFFHACATDASLVSVPNSYFFEYQPAKTGDAYGGFYVYLNSFEYREYLQSPLVDSMVAGECYYVEFWAAPSEATDFFGAPGAIDELGMYISEERPETDDPFDYTELPVTPQIVSPPDVFLSDTSEWTKVSGVYVAEGGEYWITVGNFKSDADTDTEALYGGGSPSVSYYAIDDVSITPLEGIEILPDTILCAGETIDLVPAGGADSYLWSTGDTTQVITAIETGTYIVEMNYPCGTFYDTAEIIFNNDTTEFSALEVTNCYNAFPLVLEGNELYSVYVWSTGSNDSVINVDGPGTYILTGFGGCATYVDTFYVEEIAELEEVDLTDTVLICEQWGTADIYAPPFFDTYEWSSGETSQSIIVGGTGEYTVTYSYACDSYTHTYTVITDPYLDLELDLPETVQVCPYGNPEAVIQATEGFPEYGWSNGSTNSSIIVDQPGVYTVAVEMFCRTLSDSTLVTTCEVMTVPNAFSPNNDGVNDTYFTICNPCDGFLALMIYNRWGELVFETNDPNLGWDGTFEGKDAEAGAYVYVLTSTDGAGGAQQDQGSFVLIR